MIEAIQTVVSKETEFEFQDESYEYSFLAISTDQLSTVGNLTKSSIFEKFFTTRKNRWIH